MPRESSLGLPDAMTSTQAAALAGSLEALWNEIFGRVQDLESDLRDLRRYFDPVASGKRLRRLLSELPDAPSSARGLRGPHVLAVTETKLLITPEGRVALDILRRRLVNGEDVIVLTSEALVPSLESLVTNYREWSRHRLAQTLALLAGEAEPLRLPAIGVLIALVVNRNIGPDRALPVADQQTRGIVERALLEPAAAFAQRLGAERLKIGKESLYRGWMLHEVGRRLPAALASGEAVSIVPGKEAAAVDLAARELARRDVDAAAVAGAFDALVDGLRAHLPTLAPHGLAFERAPDTRRVRAELIERFEIHSADARSRAISSAT